MTGDIINNGTVTIEATGASRAEADAFGVSSGLT